MENRKHIFDVAAARLHAVVRESIRYAISVPLVLLLFATTLFAGGNGGNVFFGINLAKALIEHTDSIYLKITNVPCRTLVWTFAGISPRSIQQVDRRLRIIKEYANTWYPMNEGKRDG